MLDECCFQPIFKEFEGQSIWNNNYLTLSTHGWSFPTSKLAWKHNREKQNQKCNDKEPKIIYFINATRGVHFSVLFFYIFKERKSWIEE